MNAAVLGTIYIYKRKWKNEDAKIPVTPSFVLALIRQIKYCLMSA